VNKKRGTRLTRQREAILQVLKNAKNHPSADEVYELVRRKLPRISLGTVYRNLEVLVENRSVQKLVTEASPTRFDGNPGTHYHAYCTGCGKLVDVPLPEDPAIAEALLEHARKNTDFLISGHTLEFIGLCPKCRKK